MNLLEEYGYRPEDITAKITETWDTLFSPQSRRRLYFETDAKMAYFLDSRLSAVTTESMGYAMMLAVQLDKKDVFDNLWRWVQAYMAIQVGKFKGNFRWQCARDGTPLYETPRPDALEYFAITMFFASHRWGDGRGALNYSKQAAALLKTGLHSLFGSWNKKNYLIKDAFSREGSTDVSYNTPQFYEIFAMLGDVEDAEFWNNAAGVSRGFMVQASNKTTGLSPESARYSGAPVRLVRRGSFCEHSYMTAINGALYSLWFGDSPDLSAVAEKLLNFFDKMEPAEFMEYEVNGTSRQRVATYPLALTAALATCALSLERRREAPSKKAVQQARRAVERFWNAPLSVGRLRYYDNCLYFFALLALSGNYRVY